MEDRRRYVEYSKESRYIIHARERPWGHATTVAIVAPDSWRWKPEHREAEKGLGNDSMDRSVGLA